MNSYERLLRAAEAMSDYSAADPLKGTPNPQRTRTTSRRVTDEMPEVQQRPRCRTEPAIHHRALRVPGVLVQVAVGARSRR